MASCNVCGKEAGESLSICQLCQQKIYSMQLSLVNSDRPDFSMKPEDPPIKFGTNRYFAVVPLRAAYFLLIFFVYGLLQTAMKELHVAGLIPALITALPIFLWARSVYRKPGSQHALLLLIGVLALFMLWMTFVND